MKNYIFLEKHLGPWHDYSSIFSKVSSDLFSDHTDKWKLQCSDTIRPYFAESLKYIIISLWELHSEGQMCSATSSGFAHIWKVVSWFQGLASLLGACKMLRMLVFSILCIYGWLESGLGLIATACLMACGYGLLLHGWRFAEVECAIHGDNESMERIVWLWPVYTNQQPHLCDETYETLHLQGGAPFHLIGSSCFSLEVYFLRNIE